MVSNRRANDAGPLSTIRYPPSSRLAAAEPRSALIAIGMGGRSIATFDVIVRLAVVVLPLRLSLDGSLVRAIAIG